MLAFQVYGHSENLSRMRRKAAAHFASLLCKRRKTLNSLLVARLGVFPLGSQGRSQGGRDGIDFSETSPVLERSDLRGVDYAGPYLRGCRTLRFRTEP